MSLDQRITVTCDHPGCAALRETRMNDETAATHRLNGIDSGWAYSEGDDFCPAHRDDLEATR